MDNEDIIGLVMIALDKEMPDSYNENRCCKTCNLKHMVWKKEY